MNERNSVHTVPLARNKITVTAWDQGPEHSGKCNSIQVSVVRQKLPELLHAQEIQDSNLETEAT
jgi:hypothetical protein